MLRKAPLALLLLVAGAQAQQQAVVPPQGRPDQRVERITYEDGGSRIDEVRMGGQSESITVKPRGAPVYAVDPANLSRSRPGDQRNGLSSAGGRTSWTVLPF